MPALTETEVLTLSLADVAVLGPHEAPELVVDVTLECPDGSTSSALIKHFSLSLSLSLCLFVCLLSRNEAQYKFHTSLTFYSGRGDKAGDIRIIILKVLYSKYKTSQRGFLLPPLPSVGNSRN